MNNVIVFPIIVYFLNCDLIAMSMSELIQKVSFQTCYQTLLSSVIVTRCETWHWLYNDVYKAESKLGNRHG
jgi:hypothetical protein